jgi:DNA repair exonuclease SbcCD ATPase subunit
MIAQKLAVVKVKKAIAAQQAQIGKEIDERSSSERRLRRQIDVLEQTIRMGEWENPRDREFADDLQAKLVRHKRQLDESNLESQIEQEVQKRLTKEKEKIEVEKRRHRQLFAAESTQLQEMMDEVRRTAAGLKNSPNCKRDSNLSDVDDVILVEDGDCDIEPD